MVLVALAVAGCARPPSGMPAAAAWMVAQQRDDGAFASPNYGVLRAAHSTTALATYALARLRPRSPAIAAACTRGLQFLRAHGIVPAALVDYPCYTAAYWILAASELDDADREADIAIALAFLRGRQLAGNRGWQPDDLAYGGFGFGVATGDKPSEGDVANLSVTSVVVRALVAAGVPADDPTLRAAAVFVGRCQISAPDDPHRHGGFVHQPGLGPLASKAGISEHGPVPYASTTSDGLVALAALDGDETLAAPAQAAALWLQRHAQPPLVAGFEHSDDHASVYEPALRLYALASLAAAMPLLPAPDPTWARAIARALHARQRPDGAYLGWSPLLKEDDPLVATALAVLALGK